MTARGRCAGVLVVGLAVAAVARPGFAAGLPLVPERLTIASSATTVPLTTCTLVASADADIDSVLNTGTATSLRVRSSVLGNRRALVTFDVAGCGIPAGAAVRTASLKLVLGTAPASSRTHAVARVTGTWTETGVTLLNQPAVAGTPTASAATGTVAGAVISWNVLADVQAFVAGSAVNNGWRVADATEGALSAVEAVYRSREHGTAAERPSLTIAYYP